MCGHGNLRSVLCDDQLSNGITVRMQLHNWSECPAKEEKQCVYGGNLLRECPHLVACSPDQWFQGCCVCEAGLQSHGDM